MRGDVVVVPSATDALEQLVLIQSLKENVTGVLSPAVTVNDHTWTWIAERHGRLDHRDDQS